MKEPFMLLETVSMLYKYVNGIALQADMNQTRQRVGPVVFERLNRWAGWIQEILYEVCKGIDQTDPVMQRYFGKVEHMDANVCLARYMTNLMCIFSQETEFRGNVERLKTHWKEIQSKGLRIGGGSTLGYNFSDDESLPADLFHQIRGMVIPAELKLELYEVLSDYDNQMDIFADLIEPYAGKLEECYRREHWLIEEVVAYWEEEFRKVSPKDFVAKCWNKDFWEGAAEETVAGISLMNSQQVIVGAARPPALTWGPHNIVIVGACLSTDSVAKRTTRALEDMSAALKYLGDRKRLEILQRLSREQGYGLEMAELMGVDSGNMSRTLAQLHQFGFLKQEKGSLRNYYKTDRKAVLEFLKQVGVAIVGEDE